MIKKRLTIFATEKDIKILKQGALYHNMNVSDYLVEAGKNKHPK